MVAAIVKEIDLRKQELKDETVQTVYLGGGTPSLLTVNELEKIFDVLYRAFNVAPDVEVTLEANPDDLMPHTLKALHRTPVNRLSVGIQSFSEADLRYMNRAHNAQEAYTCLKDALNAGFTNLTADLIYGTPGMSDAQWRKNLHTLFDLNIPHISCYALTVEDDTALAHFIKKGKTTPVDDAQAARQFELLIVEMNANNYEHYEISNFCTSGNYSKHNTAYWQGKKYVGIGPAAHSFDGTSRSWNVANNARYMTGIAAGKPLSEVELLSDNDRFNEYLMTGLRTRWGCDFTKIQRFGTTFAKHFLQTVQPYLAKKMILREGDIFRLSDKGKFLSDGIIGDLFMV